MSRFASNRRVFYFEEPLTEPGETQLRPSVCPKTGVHVLTPVLPPDLKQEESTREQQKLLASFMKQNGLSDYVAWYYTPMALDFSADLKPLITVYDCMDELSAFQGASPRLRQNEQLLFSRADLVFTGGASLFESKRKQHGAVYLFPSSVDVSHFALARTIELEPEDQRPISHPRLGFAGVIDERMDLDLLAKVAETRPEWQFVMLGPVVKIDSSKLPIAPNIHFLGMKQYADLPAYFSGWQIGMLPFALNESTRFISPTKTPEYLAAGLRVVSTPIRDVVRPYGDAKLVSVAGTPEEFVSASAKLLAEEPGGDFHARVDAFLTTSSWAKTWREMDQLMEQTLLESRLDPGRIHISSIPSSSMAGVSNV
jgi:UDP-galactopyranose mutase